MFLLRSCLISGPARARAATFLRLALDLVGPHIPRLRRRPNAGHVRVACADSLGRPRRFGRAPKVQTRLRARGCENTPRSNPAPRPLLARASTRVHTVGRTHREECSALPSGAAGMRGGRCRQAYWWVPTIDCLPLGACYWPPITGRLVLATSTRRLCLAPCYWPPTAGRSLLAAYYWPLATAGRLLLPAA